jgi:OOP family OmpA-OmpF porin
LQDEKSFMLTFDKCCIYLGGGGEVSVVVGGVHPFDSTKYGNYMTYGLRLGVNIDNSIISQVEFGYDYSKNVDYHKTYIEEIAPNEYDELTLRGEDDIHRIYFNAIKEFEVAKSTKVYALLGIGMETFSEDKSKSDWFYIESDKYDEKNGVFGQYGAGLKYYFSDNTALRAEVRHGIKVDSPHRNNLYYTLGLSYAFGKKKETLSQSEYPAQTAYIEDVKTFDLTQRNFNFDFDSAQVLESGEIILKDAAWHLKANPNLKIKIVIEGHTDFTGSDKYNMNLSQKRADAAKAKLVEYGIQADIIETKAYGENNPVVTNKTKDGRAQNRRVEIIFVQ